MKNTELQSKWKHEKTHTQMTIIDIETKSCWKRTNYYSIGIKWDNIDLHLDELYK